MQGKLYLAKLRTDIRDLTEVAVRDAVIRIVIAGDVKCVEEVCAELHILVFGDRELLAGGEVNLVETRRSL